MNGEAASTYDFRILGPLAVRTGGTELTVSSPKQRVLLASLLLRADQVVTSDELIRRLWDDQPPQDTRAALHIHTTRLRALLRGSLGLDAPPVIETHPGGYRIAMDPDALDLTRYRKAAAEARTAHSERDPDRELSALERALAEWRGDPFETVPSASLQTEVAPQLIEERLTLAERRLALVLDIGSSADVIPQLRALAAEHPLRERLREYLMRALHRSGQVAAALEEYRDYYRMLDRELGLLPGQELQQLHRQLLAETGEIHAFQATPSGTPGAKAARQAHRNAGVQPINPNAPWVVQRQLPPEATHFVGREELLQQVVTALTPRHRTVVPLVSLVGPPGIGKTALALRVAHRLGSVYPDGQWYVRLHDARGGARPVHDIIAELLHSSGADVSALPTERHQLTGVLRSRLADRRVLVVIDDVNDSEQIFDLLPGSPSCAVLALHREYRPDLVAVYGARSFTLNLLSQKEGEDVLTAVLGRAPETLCRTAVTELVELCGRLPLALRIAAGHLAGRPWRSVESFVEALREGDPLELLALGDSPSTAVRAAFSVAYNSLAALSRRFFRLLGVVGDMAFTPCTAAQLADCEPQVADQLLDKLAAAQLIEVSSEDTYRFHSLIALYAAERGVEEDRPADRRQALNRLCRWYLRRTDEAVQSCYPGFLRLFRLDPRVLAPEIDPRDAQAWLRAEQANLVALIVRAADAKLDEVCVRLVDMLRGYFTLGRLQTDWLTVAQAGLRAALSLGDQRVTAVMRLSVGLALQGLNRLPEAARELRAAHRGFIRLGVRDFEAVTVNAIAMNQLQQPTKHIDSAVTLLERGLELSRQLDLPHVEARGLMYLGMARHSQGRLRAAEAHFSRAAAILDEDGVQRSRPEVLARLGCVYADLREWDAGMANLDLALSLSEEFNASHSIVLASYGLAQIYACNGHVDLAYQYAESAVVIARDHGYVALEANARNILGGLHLIRGRSSDAHEEFSRTLSIAERIGHPQSEAHALIGLGRIELVGRRPAEAYELGMRAVAVADRSGLLLLRAQADDLCRRAGHSPAPERQVPTGEEPVDGGGADLPEVSDRLRALFPECTA
ncbi:SARP family transcriptional regulator [Streptomyces shenzhenensis]|uniref:SARP family transcriptional regulator n=1 Tax=Streptomyces shenzhenensis TaxID=943815 RepID=A0A3M0I2I0_9ACTN|nr:SARP family transcriptional regulator [Streptomyces shenzhenensis]